MVFTGTGTAGAYHAGVLRAFHEAGVKLDLVAGVGMGAITALYAAVDGGARLWEPGGLWRTPKPAPLYPWRRALRIAGAAIGAALLVLFLPLLFFLGAVLVYPLGVVLQTVGFDLGSRVARGYGALLGAAFEPGMLPTILPRLVILALVVVLAVLVVGLRNHAANGRRRERGAFWWRAIGAPLSAQEVTDRFTTGLWKLVRGAAASSEVKPPDLARAYGELLADNVGQPGFRELLLVGHDLDARRDVVFALLGEPYRQDFFVRRSAADAERRQAEAIDLAGVGGEHLADAMIASLCLPFGTDPHLMTFAADSYWRGETHRLCDRPGAVGRLIEEVASAGVDQAIIVSASAELGGPHGLSAAPRDWRARLGEQLVASEAAAIRDAAPARNRRFRNLFFVRPRHNPIGPFDVEGAYDDRSDRVQALSELMDRGYEDAYRQFIDPVIGAGGDRLQAGGIDRPRRTTSTPSTAADAPHAAKPRAN